MSDSLQPHGPHATPARLLSMEFPRQECWSGLPFPSAGDLPDLRIEPKTPALQADSLPLLPLEKPSIGEEESKTNKSDWQRKGHGEILFSFLSWVLWRNLGDLILRIFTLCWLLPITLGSHLPVLSRVYFLFFF